jgi:flagellar hook-length control protein FliK
LPAVLPQPFAVSTAAVVTPSPAAAPAIATHAMAPQLAKPIFTLAAAAPGEHVMTVKVTPENLGPVTVQAHIGADGVKVELFAPTDAGRAAVQAVLPDLRRDLAEAGLAASLDLSDRGAPQGHGDGADDGERRGRRAARAAVVLGARASPVRASILASGRAAGLDILA